MLFPSPLARLVALAAALIPAVGCTNIDWVTVDEDIGTVTAYRFQGSDLWTVGTQVHRRSSDGRWEALDMCGPYGGSSASPARVDVTFVGADVWALCAVPGGNQALLRYREGAGTLIDIPADGEVALVDTRDAVVVAGQTSLHRLEGDTWTAYAPYEGLSGPVRAAGVHADDLYAVDGASSALAHWDGGAWNEVPFAGSGIVLPPAIRDDRVWLGPLELKAGSVKAPGFSAKLRKNLELRGLALAATLPSGRAFFGYLDSALHVWEAEPGDDDVSFLGDGPFAAGSFNAGGGISSMAAIDDQTLLMVYSTGAGINAGRPIDNLIEGRL